MPYLNGIKMKKIILLIFFVCLKSILIGQITLDKFYFTVDTKQKYDIYKTKQNALHLGNRPVTHSQIAWTDIDQWYSLTYSYGIGYNINKNSSVEILKSCERYIGGLNIAFFDYGEGIGSKNTHIYSINLENGQNYIFRYNYKLGSKKLRIILSPSYIFSKSSHYYGFWPFDGILTSRQVDINGTPRYITFQASDILHQDYGLSQYFHSIDAKIRVEYTPLKWLSIFYGGGYTYGFNTLAYYNVKYTIDGFPEQHAINELNGTNYYSTFGLRLSRTKKFDKEKAKRMLRIAFLPHPKHKSNSTKKNIP